MKLKLWISGFGLADIVDMAILKFRDSWLNFIFWHVQWFFSPKGHVCSVRTTVPIGTSWTIHGPYGLYISGRMSFLHLLAKNISGRMSIMWTVRAIYSRRQSIYGPSGLIFLVGSPYMGVWTYTLGVCTYTAVFGCLNLWFGCLNLYRCALGVWTSTLGHSEHAGPHRGRPQKSYFVVALVRAIK